MTPFPKRDDRMHCANQLATFLRKFLLRIDSQQSRMRPNQARFRPDNGNAHRIFSLRVLETLEKKFSIDFVAAFDSVNKTVLCKSCNDTAVVYRRNYLDLYNADDVAVSNARLNIVSSSKNWASKQCKYDGILFVLYTMLIGSVKSTVEKVPDSKF